jgi:hypothetical protein
MGFSWGVGRADLLSPGRVPSRFRWPTPRPRVVGPVTRASRRHIVGTWVAGPFLLALACAAACGGPAAPAPRRRPDHHATTLRADRLGFMAAPRATSPNLDALAQDPWCSTRPGPTAPLTGPARSPRCSRAGRPRSSGSRTTARCSRPSETLASGSRRAASTRPRSCRNWVLRRVRSSRRGRAAGLRALRRRMDTLEPARPDLRERLARRPTDAAIAWLDGAATRGRSSCGCTTRNPHGPTRRPPIASAPRGATDGETAPRSRHRPARRGTLPKYQASTTSVVPPSTGGATRPRSASSIASSAACSGTCEPAGVLERRARGVHRRPRRVARRARFFFSHGQHLHRES